MVKLNEMTIVVDHKTNKNMNDNSERRMMSLPKKSLPQDLDLTFCQFQGLCACVNLSLIFGHPKNY